MPDDLPPEREALDLVDGRIAESEQWITEQIARIKRMQAQGHDTAKATELLEVMKETLGLIRTHRQDLLEDIYRARNSG